MSQTPQILYNSENGNLTIINDGDYTILGDVEKFRKDLQKVTATRHANWLDDLHKELRQTYLRLSLDDDTSLNTNAYDLECEVIRIKKDIQKIKEMAYWVRLEKNITCGKPEEYVELWIGNNASDYRHNLIIHGWKEVDE